MFKNIAIFIKKSFPNCNSNIACTNKFSNLQNLSFKNFAIYRSGQLRKEYDKEKGVYNKEKKAMIKRIQQEFWEEQTKVENLWLLDFLKTQKEKKRKDDAKLRSSIIKNSMVCYNNIVIIIKINIINRNQKSNTNKNLLQNKNFGENKILKSY
jgi:hypothetical protein